MAPRIEQRQQALVSHRTNFWGRPSAASTASWRYRTQSWVVKRPDDGQPAFRRSVRCKVCKKSLTYSVHSAQAARARQKRWRTITYVSLTFFVVGLLGFILLLVLDGGPVLTGIAIAASVGGFVSRLRGPRLPHALTPRSPRLCGFPAGRTKVRADL